jgi:flagellar basal body-associated protein FliL
MKWGKTLWLIILIKLFIIFVVLKIFFFPDFLSSKAKTDSAKADYVEKAIDTD